jgi:predicted Zn-dependent peptidase
MDNQPYGTWWERLPALCYPPSHPFHHSLIGSMSDLDDASLEDIEQFFRTYYTPDNAVLSITGDFDREEARRLVERHFGPIPRGGGRPPLPDMSLPPTLGGPLREVVPDDVVLSRLFLAFRSPVFGSDEYYAASVCGAILGLKKGSRLHRRLVREQQIAAEAQSFTYDLTKGSDLLVLDVTARPETTPDQLERALNHEVDRLRDEGVTADEVARAVTLIQTELIVSLQSAGDRADKLSLFATYFGDPSLVNVQADRYRAVTAEQVNAFARSRLGVENRASLLYVPRDTAASAPTRELAEAGAS